MKRPMTLLLAAVLALSMAAPALAAGDTVPAKEAPIYLRVDGHLAAHVSEETIDDSGKSYNVRTSYLINQEHYLQLREIAVLMSYSDSPFDVRYDAATNSVNILPGTDYTGDKNIPPIYGQYIEGNTVTARPSVNPMTVNGVPRTVTAYVIDGHNYMRLRDVADLAGFSVTWDQATGTVGLWSGTASGAHQATVDGAIERTDGKMPNARMNTTPTYLPDPPTCHIYDSGNGTVTVVDASQKPLESNNYVKFGPVEVSVYDTTDFHRISTMTLPEELPRFGAFLHTDKYNYIAYGQENDAEDNSVEVVRIVKYDHDWNRLGAASMHGSEEEYTQMTIPFFHGSTMVEKDGMLVLHMGMYFYRDKGGVAHQGSRTYGFYMDTYTRETGYVGAGTSHSLGSSVLAGKDTFVTVDVPDDRPYGLVVMQDRTYAELVYQERLTSSHHGYTLDAAATTANAYVMVGRQRDPDYYMDYNDDSYADILVAVLPMNDVSNDAAKVYTVGDYLDTDSKTGFLSTVASLPDGRAIALWQEYEAHPRADKYLYSDMPLDVKYAVLDQDGAPTGQTGTLPGYSTSTCQPAVVGDQLIWYANLNSTRYFYTLPLSELD